MVWVQSSYVAVGRAVLAASFMNAVHRYRESREGKGVVNKRRASGGSLTGLAAVASYSRITAAWRSFCAVSVASGCLGALIGRATSTGFGKNRLRCAT
jgi:hypothetical protein